MLKRLFGAVCTLFALGMFVMPLSEAKANDHYDHHLVIQVNENDPHKMNLALNNAANVTSYYQAKGETVQIEIVTYGPGLMMLRPGKSGVEERLANYVPSFDNISFAACENTMAGMSRKEGAEVAVYDFANPVPSGVIQIMDRQNAGWNYLRP